MRRRDFLLAAACMPFAGVNGDLATARDHAAKRLAYLNRPLNLAFEGDSITLGENATPGLDFPAQVARILQGQAPAPRVFATNSATLVQDRLDKSQATNYITYGPREAAVDASFVTGSTNVLSVFAGTNDMKRLGATAESTRDAYGDYIARRLKRGWTVMYWTVLPRSATDTPPAFEDERQKFNKYVRDFSFDNAILVDIAADQAMGGFGDSDKAEFYQQPGKVHPADAGYSRIASLAARRLLEGPCF